MTYLMHVVNIQGLFFSFQKLVSCIFTSFFLISLIIHFYLSFQRNFIFIAFSQLYVHFLFYWFSTLIFLLLLTLGLICFYYFKLILVMPFFTSSFCLFDLFSFFSLNQSPQIFVSLEATCYLFLSLYVYFSISLISAWYLLFSSLFVLRVYFVVFVFTF